MNSSYNVQIVSKQLSQKYIIHNLKLMSICHHITQISSIIKYSFQNHQKVKNFFKYYLMPTNSQLQHALLQFLIQINKTQQQENKSAKLANGSIFLSILRTVQNFEASWQPRQGNTWMNRLYNLRCIVDDIEKYFENKLDKGIKTRDIDLVAIARENQMEEINMLFEVVLTVLMNAANKEDYIKIIMKLDQKSQMTFVELIKTNIEKRQITVQEMHTTRKNFMIQQLQIENNYLRDQLMEMYKNNEKFEKNNKYLESQLAVYQDQLKITKDKYNLQTIGLQQIPEENQKLKLFVRALKEKLLIVAIDHETQVCNLKEQIATLQGKLQNNDQMEETYTLYKEKYEEATIQLNRYQAWEKEKLKLNRMLEEKDNAIQKLQSRLSELIEKNFAMEEAEVYMRMELEKKDVRFKELQKQVRTRLSVNPSTIFLMNQTRQTLSDMNNNQDYTEVKTQLEKSRLKNKELQRQNRALARKTQKSHHVQLQNKKLQRMIHELTQSRNDQIKTLLISLYQLRNENIKMNQIIHKECLNAK